MKWRVPYYLRAFSLLEAAMAILLIGIFSSALIPYWHAINAQQNLQITQLRANYIRKSVESYVVRYGFLPSAAQDTNGIAAYKLQRGYVPYKTLGIPKQYIFDGKGQLFSFVVNKYLMLDYYKNGPIYPIPIIIPSFASHVFRAYLNNGNTDSLYWNPKKNRTEFCYGTYAQEIAPVIGAHFCRIHHYQKVTPAGNQEIMIPCQASDRIIDVEVDRMYKYHDALSVRKNGRDVINTESKIYQLDVFINDESAQAETNIDEPISELKYFDYKAEQGKAKNDWYNMAMKYDHTMRANLKLEKKHLRQIRLEKKHRHKDVVAWLMISHSHKKNWYTAHNKNKREQSVFHQDGGDLIFYQTRFNLAGQINHPCTSCPQVARRKYHTIHAYQIYPHGIYAQDYIIRKGLIPYLAKHYATSPYSFSAAQLLAMYENNLNWIEQLPILIADNTSS